MSPPLDFGFTMHVCLVDVRLILCAKIHSDGARPRVIFQTENLKNSTATDVAIMINRQPTSWSVTWMMMIDSFIHPFFKARTATERHKRSHRPEGAGLRSSLEIKDQRAEYIHTLSLQLLGYEKHNVSRRHLVF
jgi:hypothetical protein